jgi:hypothetical protein
MSAIGKKSKSRWRRVLVLLGALIVFFTFVAREHFREKYKDLVQAIETSENIFLVGGQSTFALSELHRLRRDVQYIKGITLTMSLPKHSGPAVYDSGPDFDEMRTDLDDLQRALLGTSRLLSKLPDHREHETKGLWNRIYELREGAWNTTKKLSEKHKPEDAQKLVEDMNAVKNGIASLIFAINRFNEEAFKSAEQTRQSDEKLFERTTQISYFLYTLGWLLALAGKWYDVNGVEEGD